MDPPGRPGRLEPEPRPQALQRHLGPGGIMTLLVVLEVFLRYVVGSSLFFSEEIPVLDRYRLRPGVRIEGPAIVEERESTIYIGPGAWAALDELGGLVMTLGEA